MNFLKNKRNRIWISLVAAFIFTTTVPEGETAPVTAWWGTIYPKFCFSETKEMEDEQEVKISFWLAKHLDW